MQNSGTLHLGNLVLLLAYVDNLGMEQNSLVDVVSLSRGVFQKPLLLYTMLYTFSEWSYSQGGGMPGMENGG